MKILSIGLLLVALSGCQLVASLPEQEHKAEEVNVTANSFCLYLDPQRENEYNCHLTYWLRYWLDADDMTWEQRKAEIDLLTDSDQDNLRKILLCQGKDTPYQDRLRSQVWAADLIKKFDGRMQEMLAVMIYQPSQALLESESALVTLSKINGAQSTRIEEQQELVDQQRSQIEQLLKIEASIMDNTKGDPK